MIPMTPKEKKRFFTLRKKGYQAKGPGQVKGRTEKEEREYERLHEKRRSDIMAQVPLPTCCEAAQKYPAVTFTVDFDDPDWDEDADEPDPPPFLGKGSWYLLVSDNFEQERASQYPDYWSAEHPAPNFCPYCGTGLPEMRLKKPVPETVCRVLDGGYYCSTCRERLDACVCDPPSSAFEVVP